MTASVTFSCWVVWNLWWIGHGRIPPAMIKGLLGIPAPTTGGTRSFYALQAGDWRGSLYYNPMLVPILILLVLSLAAPVVNRLRGRRIEAGNWLLYAWLGVLGVGWGVKLLGPTGAW